jgi:exosome complex component RRP4
VKLLATQRELVVPGDLLDDSGRLRPGSNTYRENGAIFAAKLGLKEVRGDEISVLGLSGRYEPQRGDMVIGTVVEVGPSNWYINIGAPGDASMHVNDVPWRVEFGETSKYLKVGDTVLLRVSHVDELKKAQVSMKDRQSRQLSGGIVIEVSPTKVPRIIGRSGSMIGMVKNLTNTRVFVGQNGAIWLDGEPKDVALATAAVQKIESEAHTSGLTDRLRAWLRENGATGTETAAPSEGFESDTGGAATPSEEGRGEEGFGGREDFRPRDRDADRGREGGEGGERGFGERRERGFGREDRGERGGRFGYERGENRRFGGDRRDRGGERRGYGGGYGGRGEGRGYGREGREGADREGGREFGGRNRERGRYDRPFQSDRETVQDSEAGARPRETREWEERPPRMEREDRDRFSSEGEVRRDRYERRGFGERREGGGFRERSGEAFRERRGGEEDEGSPPGGIEGSELSDRERSEESDSGSMPGGSEPRGRPRSSEGDEDHRRRRRGHRGRGRGRGRGGGGSGE